MRITLQIIILFTLLRLLNAEIISDNNQIRKLLYAEGLKRNGLAASFSSEFVREDLTKDHWGNIFSLSYGMTDNFDIYFKIPYFVVHNDSGKFDGLGDVSFGLKYNLNPESQILYHSLMGKISLPTGYARYTPDLDGMISYKKKSFELAYLISYRKDFLTVHGNFGIIALDNIVNKKPEDVTANYKLGFDYKILEYGIRDFWLKWEFETTHSLTDNSIIKGSQFLGLAGNIYQNYSLNAGVIHQIYDNSGFGFQAGVSYLLSGNLSEKPKKLFELYPQNLKLGLFEFINEDTITTNIYLSKQLEEKLSKIDSVKVVYIKNGSKDFLKDREKTVKNSADDKQILVIYGKILKSGFVHGNYFRIPPLLMIPSIYHQLIMEIIVLDTRENKIIFKNEIKVESSLNNWPRFFTAADQDAKWYLSAAEENRLIRENSSKITHEIAARLSAKY